MTDHPIATISPDPRFRFSLAKLITKAPSGPDGEPPLYDVYRTLRGGVRLEPVVSREPAGPAPRDAPRDAHLDAPSIRKVTIQEEAR